LLGFQHLPGTKVVRAGIGDEPDEEEKVMLTEGVAFNQSTKPLTLTIIDVGQTTTQAQITLAAGVQKRFGVDLGLTMLEGDLITLRSPTYHDIVQSLQ
jgi:hypothetical protein